MAKIPNPPYPYGIPAPSMQEEYISAVALAVALENAMVPELTTVNGWEGWLSLAAAMQRAMDGMDEPRFSLYDYLDAAVNGLPDGWDYGPYFEGLLGPGSEDALAGRMIAIAEAKRASYSEGRAS